MNKVLKFYADWCGPCKTLSSVMESLPEEKKGSVEEINIDSCDKAVLSKYNVRAVPTLVALNEEGGVVKQLTGMQSLATVESLFTL